MIIPFLLTIFPISLSFVALLASGAYLIKAQLTKDQTLYHLNLGNAKKSFYIFLLCFFFPFFFIIIGMLIGLDLDKFFGISGSW